MNLSKLERSLAGLQAGMFGGIALLATLTLVYVLDRRAWWTYPNVIAAQFYGVRAVAAGAGWPTVSGIAFELLIAGCAGAVFGVLFGGFGGSRRVAFVGLAWGVVLFYANERYYKMTAPVVLAYVPRSASIVAHMIYGACLAGIGCIGGPGAGTAELGMPEIPRAGAFVTQKPPDDADSAGQERTL